MSKLEKWDVEAAVADGIYRFANELIEALDSTISLAHLAYSTEKAVAIERIRDAVKTARDNAC